MRSESYQQFVIVQSDSAHSLTEQLNAELYRLRHKHPSVTFEGMIARISYIDEDSAPEDLRDEYEQEGINLTCQDCPLFSPTLKTDGTIDNRAKYGWCPVNKYGRTCRSSRACKMLFEMINDGRVKLCLAESEVI